MAPQKLLVAYDGSIPSRKAVEIAKEIASNQPEVSVTFVHAVGTPSSSDNIDLHDALEREANKIVEELKQLTDDMSNEHEIKLLRGTAPAKMIVDCALEKGTDLIIMGSRGRGGFKGYLGSVCHSVVQTSPINVLIAKQYDSE
ncbi:MAG: universal stress protein [Coriobacteriales bacterium]|jgi:nucleotide-binding universal stress UspA family protein